MKIIVVLLLSFFFTNSVYAEEINEKEILINNKSITSLSDNKYSTKYIVKKNDEIIISSNKNIHQIYIIYEKNSTEGTITISNKSIKIGTNGFLHEYINFKKNFSNTISIKYSKDVSISEIYVFDDGALPSFVQKWIIPTEEVDLLLLSTHSDDEHLFFAGLIPTYLNLNKKIQVVYFTNHNDNTNRLHEQLNGLWEVGLNIYPIIGPFNDRFSSTLEGALSNIEKDGYSLDDTIRFQVENIRRFKPLVIVGHDINGEYSHGQHILNTHSLIKALELINDKNYLTDYKEYDVPKVYLHLYNENKIVLDYDIPLDKFDGLTAFEVSKKGYKMHNSQQYTWFTKWLNGKNNNYTSAKQITSYSPLEYGLYKTSVGNDIEKTDMFENIVERNKKSIMYKKYVINNKNEIPNVYYYLIIILLLLIGGSLLTKKRKKRK